MVPKISHGNWSQRTSRRVFLRRKLAETSWKFAKLRFIASGRGAEILQKVCGNFAEICGDFSAMAPDPPTLRETVKKARVFLFGEPLESSEKIGKTPQKARKIGKTKGKQGKKFLQ